MGTRRSRSLFHGYDTESASPRFCSLGAPKRVTRQPAEQLVTMRPSGIVPRADGAGVACLVEGGSEPGEVRRHQPGSRAASRRSRMSLCSVSFFTMCRASACSISTLQTSS